MEVPRHLPPHIPPHPQLLSLPYRSCTPWGATLNPGSICLSVPFTPAVRYDNGPLKTEIEDKVELLKASFFPQQEEAGRWAARLPNTLIINGSSLQHRNLSIGLATFHSYCKIGVWCSHVTLGWQLDLCRSPEDKRVPNPNPKLSATNNKNIFTSTNKFAPEDVIPYYCF